MLITRLFRSWTDTIAGRVTLALITLAAITAICLFIVIEYHVTSRFNAVEAERRDHLADQAQTAMARRGKTLEGIAAALVRDRSLYNATYYHLYLDGEREHLLADLADATDVFDLGYAGLKAPDDRLMAEAGRPAAKEGRERFWEALADLPEGRLRTRTVWHDGDLWILSAGEMIHNNNLLATLLVAQPMTQALGGLFGVTDDRLNPARIESAPRGARQSRVELPGDTPEPTEVWITYPDTVGAVTGDIQSVLLWVFLIAGAFFVLTSTWLLARSLRPFRNLEQAVSRLGSGALKTRIAPEGTSELRSLAECVNRMANDLERLQGQEREMAQQTRMAAIGRMSARVAHDLNNPLSVINSVARLQLRELPKDDPRRDDLELIVHQADRCRRFVRHLLDYGRELQLEPIPVELNQFLRDFLARSRTGLAVTIDLAEAQEPLWVRGDLYRLEQALENLIKNSCEATGLQGNVWLRVRRVESWAELEVADSGPGFSETERKHALEPFFTTKSDGIGLGLANVDLIVRAHGGNLLLDPRGAPQIRMRLPLTNATTGAATDNVVPALFRSG